VTDQSETPGTQRPPPEAGGLPGAPAPVPPPEAGGSPGAPAPLPPTEAGIPPVAPPPPPPSSSPGRSPAEIADERPELAVGAAFAGGFLLAMILKRLAR
jgi:hypothetical protein